MSGPNVGLRGPIIIRFNMGIGLFYALCVVLPAALVLVGVVLGNGGSQGAVGGSPWSGSPAARTVATTTATVTDSAGPHAADASLGQASAVSEEERRRKKEKERREEGSIVRTGCLLEERAAQYLRIPRGSISLDAFISYQKQQQQQQQQQDGDPTSTKLQSLMDRITLYLDDKAAAAVYDRKFPLEAGRRKKVGEVCKPYWGEDN